jgi:Peptidase_C39 like family
LIGFREGAEVAQAANVLIAPGDCGADDVTFGIQGSLPSQIEIDSLVIVGVDPWEFEVLGFCCGRARLRYTLQYQPTTTRCEVTVTPYTQNDPAWGGQVYDSTVHTIADKGCALTSLAMALTFAGSTVNPGALNDTMKDNTGYYAGSSVHWLNTTEGFSGNSLRWTYLQDLGGDRDRLAQEVCGGNPVVVWVPSLVVTGGSHFVVVTGAPDDATPQTPLSEFGIVDPAGIETTLEAYGDFVLRGYPVASTSLSPPLYSVGRLTSPQAATAVQPVLVISFVGGSMLVVDQQGRRAGQESPGGEIFDEIPSANYSENEAPSLEVPGPDTDPQVSVTVIRGAVGVLEVTLTAATTTTGGQLHVVGERSDFSLQPNNIVPLSVTEGEMYNFEIEYDPESATGATLTRIEPLELSADTYLKQGTPNKNQGDLDHLRIRQSGKNRALVQFDSGDLVSSVGSGSLLSATLEFTISDNGNNWGTDGRTIDAHRMTRAWTELGATWNCANDIDTSDQSPDCTGDEWEMGKKNQPEVHPWVEQPTATALITKFQTGVVSFDVTADVEAFLAGQEENYGWLIRKTSEGQAGRIEFASRETATGARLVLEVQHDPGGS